MAHASGMPLYAGPKMMSGFGTEGLAARKSTMVCAYACAMAERSGAEWKEPALKK